jgi:hypothetical protein
MTLDTPDKADNPSVALFNVLADVNIDMMTIRQSVASDPAVIDATRGCDIRRYRAFDSDEEYPCFEAYVEAETRAGAVFCWSLDIKRTSLGWTFQRQMSERTADGAEPGPEQEFQDYTFATFDDLANNWSALMTEFKESAEHFDFGG